MDALFVVQAIELMHVLVEDDYVLVPDDDQVLISVERVDQESISEHFREVTLAI